MPQRGHKAQRSGTNSSDQARRGARGRGHGTTTVHRNSARGTMSTANALTGARESGSTQQRSAPSRTTSGVGSGGEQPGRRNASRRREPSAPATRGQAAGRASTGVTRTGRAGESPVRREVRRTQHQPTGPIGPSGRPAREDGLLQTNQVDRGRASRGKTSAGKHARSDQARTRSAPDNGDDAMPDGFGGITEDAFEVDD